MINTEIGNERNRILDSDTLLKAGEVSRQMNISRAMDTRTGNSLVTRIVLEPGIARSAYD